MMSASGFKARVDSLTIVLRRLYAMGSTDSPLVLLTSWRHIRFYPRTYVKEFV